MNTSELKAAIKAVAENAGYLEVGPNVFRAKWEMQDVEHFLFFVRYGPSKCFMHADFGMRDVAAQEFAIASVDSFMPPGFNHFIRKPKHVCLLRYSLGRLASWGIRETIDLDQFTSEQLKTELSKAIELQLIPIIVKIHDRNSLLEFLLRRSDDLANYRGNIGIKVAYISFLRHKAGVPMEAIRSELAGITSTSSVLFKGQGIDGKVLIENITQQLTELPK